ncbi:MAG: RNA polymerase sigma factor (sigma-70 family) [Urechidicola sp.]|jgi:RNA polymerase sigma factor (sigma-70 family)
MRHKCSQLSLLNIHFCCLIEVNVEKSNRGYAPTKKPNILISRFNPILQHYALTQLRLNKGASFIHRKPTALATDDQLIRAYSRGQVDAFDLLYSRYKKLLYSYLNNNCHSSSVDELFQEVWLRVIASAGRYKSKNHFRAWLFTLAHNCLVDHYRRQSKRSTTFSSDMDSHLGSVIASTYQDTHGANDIAITGQLDVEKITENQQLAASLSAAISELSQEQREVFHLREDAGFSISDIAKIQGITFETAKSRLRYAYAKLRRQLHEVYP